MEKSINIILRFLFVQQMATVLFKNKIQFIKFFILIAILESVVISETYAQSSGKKWNLGLGGGITQYNGDLGQGFYKIDQPYYGFASMSVSRYLGKYADVFISGSTGEAGYKSDAAGFRLKMTTASLNLRFYAVRPEAHFRPFVYGGGGVLVWDRSIWALPGDIETRNDLVLPSFGGGFSVRLNDVVNILIQESFMLSQKDDIDRTVAKYNDAFLFHTAGLTFNLGRKKDSDDDGIGDNKDLCPGTPRGVKVDAAGCPTDTDGDGIADYLDDCPQQFGLAALKGCPDTDGDGIADKDDECPLEKGLLSVKGCPDSDGDGVADKNDKCPETPKGFKVGADGCPFDRDKDGVLDDEDACPDVQGPVQYKGCPDSDGDGVPDNIDKCPTEKGIAINKGCPEMEKADLLKISQIAGSIYFESNSDKIKPVSLPQLDMLVELLKKYDSVNLTVEGHTDNSGDETYNLKLSQKRSEAVKNYLISKGIFEARILAKGYGEFKPVSDNLTPEGRAKNRRVVLKVSY